MSLIDEIKAKSSSLFAFADQAVFSGGSFLLILLLPKKDWLESTDFGYYQIAWMVLLFFSSFHQEMVISPMLTLGAKKAKEEQRSYLGDLFYYNLLFVLIAGLGTYLVALFGKSLSGDWHSETLDYILPFIVMGFLLVDYFRKNFYLLGKPTMAFAQTLINYSGLFGSVLYFKFTEQLSLETTYISFGIGYALASVLGLVSYTWSWLNIDQFKQLVREHFNFSGWLTLKAGLTWMATNYYVVEAGKLNTDNFVYGAVIVSSVRVSLGLMGLFSAFYQVLENIIPIAAAKIYVEQGYQGLKNYLIKSTLKNAMIMFPILILIFFGAEWLLEKIYPGEQYHEYAHVLQGFALMNVIIFLGYPIRFALRTMELTRPIFIGYFISGLFSLFTAKWMVTKFEEYGVVAGMLITQVLTLGYYLIVLNLQNRRLSE